MGAQERVAQYQLLAEWKVEEQAQWERAAAAKEDDNLALDRYRKQVHVLLYAGSLTKHRETLP